MSAMFNAGVLATACATILLMAPSSKVGAQSLNEITAVARTKVAPRARLNAPRPSDRETSAVGRPISAEREGSVDAPLMDVEASSWANSDIQIARARCSYLLRPIKAEVVVLDPIKKGPCGDPAPVKLVSVGASPKVTFDPPVTVNCDMVRSLHDWVTKDLQPLAKRILRSPIVEIETMSSYSCRNAYGRKNGRLSEHGRANAIDIRGFITAERKRTRLVAHWGPTRRDIEASRLAAERLKNKRYKSLVNTEQKSGEQNATPVAEAVGQDTTVSRRDQLATAAALAEPQTLLRPSFIDEMSSLAARGIGSPRDDGLGTTILGVAPSRLGGPALSSLGQEEKEAAASWPVTLVSEMIDASQADTPRARFLRAAHGTACKIFGTVLGPEANNAHRNHLHVDLAQRELGSYCR
jgi:hypothetical protein